MGPQPAEIAPAQHVHQIVFPCRSRSPCASGCALSGPRMQGRISLAVPVCRSAADGVASVAKTAPDKAHGLRAKADDFER